MYLTETHRLTTAAFQPKLRLGQWAATRPDLIPEDHSAPTSLGRFASAYGYMDGLVSHSASMGTLRCVSWGDLGVYDLLKMFTGHLP